MKYFFFLSLLCASATQTAMLASIRSALMHISRTTVTAQQTRTFSFCSDKCARDMPTEFGKGWSGCKKRNRNLLHIPMAMDYANDSRGRFVGEDPAIVNYISHYLHDPNLICRAAVPELLEIACRKALPNAIAAILSAAKKHNIDITDSMALHCTNTEEIAEMLIEHGMQVNRIPTTRTAWTPLHICQDYFIPFLLRKGADAQQEMQRNTPDGELIRWYDERGTCYGDVFSVGEMTAALKPTMSQEELCAAMDKHCAVDWTCEKKNSWKSFDLRLTPPALAVKNADVRRTETFLEHASPEAIIPQLEKLHFLTKVMTAWEPHNKWTYIWLRWMLHDYECRMQTTNKF